MFSLSNALATRTCDDFLHLAYGKDRPLFAGLWGTSSNISCDCKILRLSSRDVTCPSSPHRRVSPLASASLAPVHMKLQFGFPLLCRRCCLPCYTTSLCFTACFCQPGSCSGELHIEGNPAFVFHALLDIAVLHRLILRARLLCSSARNWFSTFLAKILPVLLDGLETLDDLPLLCRVLYK